MRDFSLAGLLQMQYSAMSLFAVVDGMSLDEAALCGVHPHLAAHNIKSNVYVHGVRAVFDALAGWPPHKRTKKDIEDAIQVLRLAGVTDFRLRSNGLLPGVSA